MSGFRSNSRWFLKHIPLRAWIAVRSYHSFSHSLPWLAFAGGDPKLLMRAARQKTKSDLFIFGCPPPPRTRHRAASTIIPSRRYKLRATGPRRPTQIDFLGPFRASRRRSSPDGRRQARLDDHERLGERRLVGDGQVDEAFGPGRQDRFQTFGGAAGEKHGRLAGREIDHPMSHQNTPRLRPVPSALAQASFAANRLAQEAARSPAPPSGAARSPLTFGRERALAQSPRFIHCQFILARALFLCKAGILFMRITLSS